MKRILFVAIGIVLVAGCTSKRSSNGSVSGKITYNGKPVNGAVLHFHPASGEGGVVNVGVSQDGTFIGSDLPPGEYKIVVEGSKPPPEAMNLPKFPKGMDPAKKAEMEQKYQAAKGGEAPTIKFPDKYKSAKSSDLTITITKGKQEKKNIELKD